MKNQLLLVLTISFLMINCNNTEKSKTDNKQKTENIVEPTETNFIGSWSRSFVISEEHTAEVTYVFWKDSIQYEMKGPMQTNYTLIKDTTLEDRWIGEKDGKKYVVFIKDRTKDEITLLKLKSKDIEDALNMPFPSDSARSKFSSWNTYSKK